MFRVLLQSNGWVTEVLGGQRWADIFEQFHKSKNCSFFSKILKFKHSLSFGMMPHDLAAIVFELSRVSQDRLAMEYEDQLAFLSRKLCEANWKYEKLKEALTAQHQQLLIYKACVRKEKGHNIPSEDPASAVVPKNNEHDDFRAVVSRDGLSDSINSKSVRPSVVFSSSSKSGENFIEDELLDRSIGIRARIKLPSPPPRLMNAASNFIDLPSKNDLFFDDFPNSPLLPESSNKKRKADGIPSNHFSKLVALPNPERTAVSKYHQDQYVIDLDETENDLDNIFRNHPMTVITRSVTDVGAHKAKTSVKKKLPSPKPLAFHQKINRNSMVAKNDNATASTRQLQQNKPSANMRCVEVVRKKDDRAALPGYQCDQCAAFYNVQIEQGILDKSKVNEFLQLCSRHKSKWTPPQTPEGFWDLSVRTPDEWKR
jgi:hypothetical protein